MKGRVSISGGGKAHTSRSLFRNSACLCLLVVLILCNLASGVPDPQGLHDYSYVECGTAIYPGSGNVVVTFDIKVVTDNTGWNRLTGYTCPVLITVTNGALVEVDTTLSSVLGGTPVAGWEFNSTLIGPPPYDNPTQSPFHFAAGGVSASGGLNPGVYTMMHINLELSDTCTISIDTLSAPTLSPVWATEAAEEIDFAWGGPPGLGYEQGGAICFFSTCNQTHAVGTGIGDLGDSVGHIDSYYDCNQYQLVDITRRANNNPHGHNGYMGPNSYISTRTTMGVLADPDNVWDDSSQSAGVSAHLYAGKTYDYLLHKLGRNSFDGLGKSMITVVEVPDSNKKNLAEFNSNLDRLEIYQAAPDSVGLQESQRYSYAACLDVIAHEWAHGIVKYSSAIRRFGEAGALNESFCDMFGATVAWANGDLDWWLIGEKSWDSPNADRNMANPLPLQPDTYMGEKWYGQDTCLTPDDSNDSCGVRTNMGVPNKVFYLLAEGGMHNGIEVTGIGIENAMKIMYRANDLYWDNTSNFSFVEAASGSIRSAFDLDYSNNSALQTSRAWTAVRVCTTSVGDVDASGTITLGDVIYLANYVFNVQIGDWPVSPQCKGDLNGNGMISLADIVWLACYVFDKERLPCLASNPINCFLPRPSGECCKLP